MLQRLGIRGKILAVVAVPIIVLLLAAGFVTFNAVGDLRSSRQTEQLLTFVDASGTLVSALQDERFIAANYDHSASDGLAKRTSARKSLDAAVTALDAVTAGGSSDAVAAANRAHAILDGAAGTSLKKLRAVDVTEKGEGELPTFPTADEIAAMSSGYDAAIAAMKKLQTSTNASPPVVEALVTLSYALGAEASTSATYLTEPQQYQDGIEAAFAATDAARTAFTDQLGKVATIARDDRVIALANQVSSQLGQLSSIRGFAVARSGGVNALVAFYTDVLANAVRIGDEAAGAVTDLDLASRLRGYGSMQVLIEKMRVEEEFVQQLLRAGVFQQGEVDTQRRDLAETDIALATAQRNVDPLPNIAAVPDFGASAPTDGTDGASFASIRASVSDGLSTSLIQQRSSDWNQQVAEELAVQVPIRDAVWASAKARSSDAAQTALLQTLVTIAAAVLVVVASLVIALLIARRIVNPLRRLTTTATAVRQELPRLVERVAMPGETVDVAEVQIPVESQDEVGRLAEAFNGVNAATLAIASEQAALRGSISEMFVNVARRDQVLLNRQLASIDDMERSEENSETLTKLFALDHLATRMRRNSESLLVLAGIDTGRRLRRPMPLSDVIRTASSEIELYERVQLDLDADPAMVGHSALTAAHLFAELLENATVFSDPGTPVVVRTMERDGQFVVEIVDSGIGMSATELAEANNRVASTAASEILGAQRLGLFVVGRIARRIGARVTLESTEGEGTLATVTLSPSLFDARASMEPAHTAAANVDRAFNAPAALVTHNVADEQFDEPPAGYRPSVVEAALAVATPDVAADVPVAPVDAPEPASEATEPDADLTEPSVEELIASDAASAPPGVAVDTAALTAGLNATGLPTRRRREDQPERVDDPAHVMGLPVRATAAQLSALDAEASDEAFTPSVPANEVAPQTPEERASMFRGFRAMREPSEVSKDVDGDTESLGHAARRESSAPAGAPGLAETAIPGLEEDADLTASVPVDAQAPAASETDRVDATAAADEPGAEVSATEGPATEADSDEDAAGAPAVQEPQIVFGFDHDDSEFQLPELDSGAMSAGAMVIPALEEDDEDIPVREVRAETVAAPAGGPVPDLDDDDDGSSALAEVVPAELESSAPHADDEPAPMSDDSFPAAAAGPEADAAEGFGVGQPDAVDSPVAPFGYADAYARGEAPSNPWGVDSVSLDDPLADQFEHDSPSMDDLIADSAEAVTARPGFFARLFGRGKTAAPAPPVADEPAEAGAAVAVPAFAPSDEQEPSSEIVPDAAPAPAYDDEAAPSHDAAPQPKDLAAFDPERAVAAAPLYEPLPEEPFAAASLNDALPEPEYAPIEDALLPEPEPEPATGILAPAFTPQEDAEDDAAFAARELLAETAHEAESEPEPVLEPEPEPVLEPEPEVGPEPEPEPSLLTTSFTPQENLEDDPAYFATQLLPHTPREPEPEPEVADTGALALRGDRSDRAAAVGAEPGQSFSPDELASPGGWEAAGASALAESAHGGVGVYRPIVDLQPEPDAEDGPERDFTSDVFSELNSLSASRPKVEKTAAGLQRRRSVDAPAPEVTPIKDEVTMDPKERDAEEVRTRFSNFYSGTKRARDDVAEFEQRTQPAPAPE